MQFVVQQKWAFHSLMCLNLKCSFSCNKTCHFFSLLSAYKNTLSSVDIQDYLWWLVMTWGWIHPLVYPIDVWFTSLNLRGSWRKWYLLNLSCSSEVSKRFAASSLVWVCSRDWYLLLSWAIFSLTVGMPVLCWFDDSGYTNLRLWSLITFCFGTFLLFLC